MIFIGSVQMTYLRPVLYLPPWLHCFWYPTYHSRPEIDQIGQFMVFLGVEGIVLVTFKWLIWCDNWIPLFEYMQFDTQYVSIGQKLVKMAIFYGLLGFKVKFFLVSVQILKSSEELVPKIPHIPQSDLKCPRYPGELPEYTQTNISLLYI